jgi:hypothetical protein
LIEPYKVTALRMGLILDVDYSQIVYLKDMGTRMDFPTWGVLLQGQGKNILVDLGIYDPEWASENIIKCVRQDVDATSLQKILTMLSLHIFTGIT